MDNYIDIELIVVEPIYLELNVEPVNYIGTAQAGPRGAKGEPGDSTQNHWYIDGDEVVPKDSKFLNVQHLTNIDSILARVNHDHDIGNQVLNFENSLV